MLNQTYWGIKPVGGWQIACDYRACVGNDTSLVFG
jgi:hypothetical protein